MKSGPEVVLILDNIRSVHNVGPIFRTADAFGVSKIYCLGVTPTPLDRFGRARKDLTKVSLGAEKSVSWKKEGKGVGLIEELKSKGFFILALEQGEGALSCNEISPKEKIALIVGSETDGVSNELRITSGALLEIPMRGEKESLNVAVAAGIALAFIVGVNR